MKKKIRFPRPSLVLLQTPRSRPSETFHPKTWILGPISRHYQTSLCPTGERGGIVDQNGKVRDESTRVSYRSLVSGSTRPSNVHGVN